jgi:hypothetical protein
VSLSLTIVTAVTRREAIDSVWIGRLAGGIST